MNVRHLMMTMLLMTSGCVVGTDVDNCNELSCDGCCDAYGGCRRGTENSTCGGGGLSCAYCQYPNVCNKLSATTGQCSQCGDKKCDANETCSSCPGDCGNCCGNGVCSGGETCSTCPSDCGNCCGNGTCNVGETCSSCASDCGVCTSGNNHDVCSFSSQCKSAGATCIASTGSTTKRCRTSCTTSSTCTNVAGYPADVAYCATSGICFLGCPSVGASCPYGAQCKLRSDGSCCVCL